jgi:phosphohistidine phosphatase
MKILYIIRHAKSSWEDISLSDFERPLNKRGEKDAPFMGKVLKELHVRPDIVYSSPALRAKMTAEIITKEVHYDKDILFVDAIYEADVRTLHEFITTIDDENSIVFLFGHNTSLNEVAYKYVGFNENIPTCGVVSIVFDIENWSEISERNAKFLSFDYPKKYR